MGDVLLVNPIFAVLILTATGGVLSVLAIAEFIKTIIKDYKADKGITGDTFTDTRTGKRTIACFSAGVYTVAVAYFGGLTDASLMTIDPFMRYLIFWIALSVISMGSYDVFLKRKGIIQGTLVSSEITASGPLKTLVANEHSPEGVLEGRRKGDRMGFTKEEPPESNKVEIL